MTLIKFFALNYFQLVEKVREDVSIFPFQMSSYSWFHNVYHSTFNGMVLPSRQNLIRNGTLAIHQNNPSRFWMIKNFSFSKEFSRLFKSRKFKIRFYKNSSAMIQLPIYLPKICVTYYLKTIISKNTKVNQIKKILR